VNDVEKAAQLIHIVQFPRKSCRQVKPEAVHVAFNRKVPK
jgi:hypothetical protein